jgi:hypothetical protein
MGWSRVKTEKVFPNADGRIWPRRTAPKKKPKPPKPKKPIGRPPHAVTDYTRKQVRMAMALGLTQDEAALVMGISLRSLKNHYAEDIKRGAVDLIFDVGSNVAMVAKDPNHKDFMKAATLVLKARAKWAETTKTEVTGKDGKPIEHTAVPAIDSRNLSAAHRAQLKAILLAAKGAPQAPEPEEETDDED